MPGEMKTLRVTCVECGERFIVRFPLVDAAAEGQGWEVVACLYCSKQVKIPLERKYMEAGDLIRSLKVDP